MIVIVDYGMGNLGSIANMCKRLGIPAAISSRLEEIEAADRLILPGVGAFDQGMRNLQEMGLLPTLHRRVTQEGIPVLGICLGMQLMTQSSEEGSLPGLGWIAGHTRHLLHSTEVVPGSVKLPHIGWNFIDCAREHPIVQGLGVDPRFYFVHTYKVQCRSESDVLCHTTYAGIRFESGIARDNIIGVQFHPEKSHRFGMQIIRNFSCWNCVPSGTTQASRAG